ncbi:hypothetical protein YC2023_009878 [Brassica napus]
MKGFGGSNEQNGNATEPRDDVKDTTKEERKEAEPSDSKIICGNEVIDSRKAGSGFGRTSPSGQYRKVGKKINR